MSSIIWIQPPVQKCASRAGCLLMSCATTDLTILPGVDTMATDVIIMTQQITFTSHCMTLHVQDPELSQTMYYLIVEPHWDAVLILQAMTCLMCYDVVSFVHTIYTSTRLQTDSEDLPSLQLTRLRYHR